MIFWTDLDDCCGSQIPPLEKVRTSGLTSWPWILGFRSGLYGPDSRFLSPNSEIEPWYWVFGSSKIPWSRVSSFGYVLFIVNVLPT